MKMYKENIKTKVVTDEEKSKLKSSMVSINNLLPIPVRKVPDSWCTSTSTLFTSVQLPTANITKLWSHQQLPTAVSCNNPSISYIINYNWSFI